MKKNLSLALAILASAAVIATYFLYFKVEEKKSFSIHEEFDPSTTMTPGTGDAALPLSDKPENESAIVNGVANATRRGDTASLAFERNLLSGTSLDSKKIQPLLLSEKFDALLEQFANQSAADADASELSDVYGKMVEAQIQKNNLKLQVDRLICGTQICVGSFRNGSDSEYASWTTAFFSDPKTPSYGFVDTTVARGQGESQHRFIFSIDPAANSVVIPTPRP